MAQVTISESGLPVLVDIRTVTERFYLRSMTGTCSTGQSARNLWLMRQDVRLVQRPAPFERGIRIDATFRTDLVARDIQD